MTETEFDALARRLDQIEERAVTKADVFQAVLAVNIFIFATIVGTIVVLSATGVIK
ncbi:hypothetical protein [Afifella aestuarii]|uniref:hypothetical protein n=1 Tax=Afifella aestuarii TaxID=1909496 RepID=UPI0013E35F14|nr:hypothetical protein [Afifella aestuarii]